MYTGDTIILDYPSMAKLTDDDKARMEQITDWVKKWAVKLCLDPDARIIVNYADKPGMMEVNEDKADYFCWVMTVHRDCLHPSRDSFREMDVIHEILHKVIYHLYTRIAYNLVCEDCKKLMEKAEESLVTKLELIISRLYFGSDCKLSPGVFGAGEEEEEEGEEEE